LNETNIISVLCYSLTESKIWVLWSKDTDFHISRIPTTNKDWQLTGARIYLSCSLYVVASCLAYFVCVAFVLMVGCGCHYLPWMFLERLYNPTLHCWWKITFRLWCWASGKLPYILDSIFQITPLNG
jgi:hypothetical protein